MFVCLFVCLFASLVLWSVAHAEPIHEPFIVVVFAVGVVDVFVAVFCWIVRVNYLLLDRPSVRPSFCQSMRQSRGLKTSKLVSRANVRPSVSHVACSLVSLSVDRMSVHPLVTWPVH